jgi:mitochondrial chaperone BCS1
MSMFDLIRKLLAGQNQFASGGLLLMIVGTLGVWLRAVPLRLWEWIVGQTTMLITVKDDDAAFAWVKEWFLEQPLSKRLRRVDLDTTLRNTDMALIPSPGHHWFWYAGRPFWVLFYRSEEGKGWSPRRAESLTFRTIGRDQATLKRFVADIVACHRRRMGLASHLYVYDSGWTQVQAYAARSLASVILNPGEMEKLMQDVSRFLRSRERYRVLGVPYHRGYLLYGPPGTGKTSLVSGLAAEFGMSIYLVNLTEFNDRTLKYAIGDVPEHSVILFEDIDCMRTGKARPDSASWKEPSNSAGKETGSEPDGLGVTLSGLLNVLDGLNAPENVLFAMTTNRMEVLDRALLRPGRIDYRLFLGKASLHQRLELYRRFFPCASELEAESFVANTLSLETMAEFQGRLLSLEQNQPRERNEQTTDSIELERVCTARE